MAATLEFIHCLPVFERTASRKSNGYVLMSCCEQGKTYHDKSSATVIDYLLEIKNYTRSLQNPSLDRSKFVNRVQTDMQNFAHKKCVSFL